MMRATSSTTSTVQISIMKLQMVFLQSNQLVTHEMMVEPSQSNFIDEE